MRDHSERKCLSRLRVLLWPRSLRCSGACAAHLRPGLPLSMHGLDTMRGRLAGLRALARRGGWRDLRLLDRYRLWGQGPTMPDLSAQAGFDPRRLCLRPVPCDDPRFPSCSLWSLARRRSATPSGGLCQPCGSDNDCQTKATGPSDGPFCRLDGLCGCAKTTDCPKGQTCQDDRRAIGRREVLLGFCALHRRLAWVSAGSC